MKEIFSEILKNKNLMRILIGVSSAYALGAVMTFFSIILCFAGEVSFAEGVALTILQMFAGSFVIGGTIYKEISTNN